MKSPKLLKDRFLEKMQQKPVVFFRKTIGSNNSFTVIENNFIFLIAEFEFKVTVHLWSMRKNTELLDVD